MEAIRDDRGQVQFDVTPKTLVLIGVRKNVMLHFFGKSLLFFESQ